ncbi:MAG: hypothetical protein FJZ56_03965, partial [Chlamydiae bacterium]|nr:hypothetical protein [Chlamydiota bacterium]
MFFLSLLKVSIRASITQKGAFVCDLLLMIFNNLIFIALWWIFFDRFKEIGNWKMADMIALNAIGLGAYGLMRVFFGGVINLSKTILNGSLDIFLTQPKNVLLHILMSTSYPKGFGHLLSAFILIVIGDLYSHVGSILIGITT